MAHTVLLLSYGAQFAILHLFLIWLFTRVRFKFFYDVVPRLPTFLCIEDIYVPSLPITSECRNCRRLCCFTGLSWSQNHRSSPCTSDPVTESVCVVTAEQRRCSYTVAFHCWPAAVMNLSTRQKLCSSSLLRSYSASGWDGGHLPSGFGTATL